MTRAVVFAYHDVGVRCLQTLLGGDIDVPLVVTHRDNPAENIWFASVADLAGRYDIPTLFPEDPNLPLVAQRVAAARPDFIFSFYYRHMLGAPLLSCAARGALNIHGSMLPKYRGRVPVNWALVHGEKQTGATLHYMMEKPDAGDIVDQQAVPILPDDTAFDVFRKVCVAAEMVLHRSLPALVAGNAARRQQDLSMGSYFGGRKPEDGRIDWQCPAAVVHNLVRAVAPPYPGAFTTIGGRSVRLLRTLLQPGRRGPCAKPSLYCEANRWYAQCGDAAVLRIVELELEGKILTDEGIGATFGKTSLVLPSNTLEKA
jgi:methionyl-tRNA formyltransferase